MAMKAIVIENIRYSNRNSAGQGGVPGRSFPFPPQSSTCINRNKLARVPEM